MTTMIESNGSKWAGEAPDSVDKLLAVLEANPLDRTFESYGNFIYPCEDKQGTVRFWGNFFNLSHVFCIDSDESDTIERLTAAIRANQKRHDYLAQPKPLTIEELEAQRLADAQKAAIKSREMRGLQ